MHRLRADKSGCACSGGQRAADGSFGDELGRELAATWGEGTFVNATQGSPGRVLQAHALFEQGSCMVMRGRGVAGSVGRRSVNELGDGVDANAPASRVQMLAH